MVVETKRVLCCGVAFAALFVTDFSEQTTCASAALREAWNLAIPLCRERWERTGEAWAGLQVARGLRRLPGPRAQPDLRATVRMAKAVIADSRDPWPSRVMADVYAVLGDAAQRDDDPYESRLAWEKALEGYRTLHDGKEIARAAHGLGGAYLQLGDLGQAHRYAEEAVDEARRGGDPMLLYYQMGRADVLRARGLPDEAERVFDEMRPLLSKPYEESWYLLKRGILLSSRGLLVPARAELSKALEVFARSGDQLKDLKLSVHLNLAWIDRVEGSFAASHAHLDIAAELGARPIDLHFHRGLVLADEGKLRDAATELAAAQRQIELGQWSWAVPYNRGRVAEALGEVDGAVAAYRDSIAAVQVLTERAGSFTPDVASNHREPYQRLLGVYARRGDWERAFQMVMELDLLSLVTSEAVPLSGQLDKGLPRHPSPPLLPPLPAVAEVTAAWRGRHLVAVVSDEETMWRLEVKGGAVSGLAVGQAAPLEEAANDLESAPTDEASARLLGAAVLPPAAEVRSEDGVLDVLLVGPVARLPLAALRRGDALALATTPLARVLGVLPRGERRPERSGAVVLGDPNRNLSKAREEAALVAELLAVRPLLGEAATAEALQAAGGAALFHLAGHSSSTMDGAVLHLFDRDVGTAEIAGRASAPGVVVLASCGGAAARDAAGWGSLAAAFLTAGSEAVIAAGHSVDDGMTRELVLALYQQREDGRPIDVARRPARALQLAQLAQRKALPAELWAAFSVLRAPPRLPAAPAAQARQPH